MRHQILPLVTAAALAAFGCASSGLIATSWPIDPGDAVNLEANQGLLVVHVRSNLPVQTIDVGGVLAAEDLLEGTSVRLIGITAGTYRWATIQLQGDRFRFPDHERLRFRVEPGLINYVGMIDVERSGPLSLGLHALDRSAMALEQLRERYPDLTARYRMVYSGSARHVFLERHRNAKERPGPERVRRDAKSESRQSAAADALFSVPALLRVALNPSGTLSFTQGFNAGTQVVNVRITSNGANTTVYSHAGPIHVEWEDDDTLIVQTGDGRERFVIDLELHEFGVVSRQHPIAARGWMIDPLPLERGEVLWADWDGVSSFLFRVPVAELIRPTNSGFKDIQEPNPFAPGRFWTTRQRVSVIGAKYRIAELPHLVLQWTTDRHGIPCAAITLKNEEPIRIALLYRDTERQRWQELGSWGATDRFPIPVGMVREGRDLLVLSAQDSDTAVLRTYRVSDRALGDVIYAQPGADLTGVVWDYHSPEVIAVYWEQAGIRRYHYFDEFDGAQQSWLDQLHPDEAVHLTSRSADRGLFTILVSGPRNPGHHQLLDTARRTTEDLGEAMPWIAQDRLASVTAIDVRTKDGKSIEAFFTKPRRFSGKRPPLIVMPHGGPIGIQDTREFNPVVQALAARGYAVLQPNYRGSSGRGTGFLESGMGAWGQGIENDIEAALDTVISKQLVDPNRVCIFGGSYGGYSALISITRRPQRYRCAAALAAPTDLLLMSSEYQGSPDGERMFAKIVGDPDKNREHLIEISPAYRAAEMDVPILLIQGDQDPVVDPEHAYRMRAMLDAKGRPYEWMLLEDATHDPSPKQWVQLMNRVFGFLAQHLQTGSGSGK
jgi:pimeloyl-ACP methyl ester carboxylesterase